MAFCHQEPQCKDKQAIFVTYDLLSKESKASLPGDQANKASILKKTPGDVPNVCHKQSC